MITWLQPKLSKAMISIFHGRVIHPMASRALLDKPQEKVLLGVLELAGLTGPDQNLPAPVCLKNGKSNAGRPMHFYLNYSGSTQSFAYPYNAGTDVITGKPITKLANLTLAPWDLAVIGAQYMKR
jgi:hypothetical protein